MFRQLRTLAHARERILRYIVGSTHGLQAVLNDYFPELRKLFWSMKAKGLWTLLETYPFPEDVRHAGLDAVTALLSKGTGKKRHIQEQAARIYRAAVESVGLKAITKADRARLTMYLEEIKRSDARRKLLEHEMKELLKEIPLAEYILSLPGMGEVAARYSWGNSGTLSTLTILGRSSSLQVTIQRRTTRDYGWAGRSSRRRDAGSCGSVSSSWCLRLVHRSPFFKAYYEQKKKGFNRPLEKTEALCAVILKLIRVLFALMRDRRMFTVTNLQGIPRGAAVAIDDMLGYCAQVKAGQEVLILAQIDGLYGGINLVDEQVISWVQAAVQPKGLTSNYTNFK